MTQAVAVWVGSEIPEYIKESIEFNSAKVEELHIITNLVAEFKSLNANIIVHDYKKYYTRPIQVTQTKAFFWEITKNRLEIVCRFVKDQNFNGVHFELDNLLLCLEKLSEFWYEHIFLVPRDAECRAIGSIILIRPPGADLLLNFMKDKVFENDMILLGQFLDAHKATDLVCALPTELSLEKKNSWRTLDTGSIIFDAAALGQYLLGIDRRNTFGLIFNGFINKHSTEKLLKYKFYLKGEHLYIEDRIIFNIHIHSKNIKKFTHRNELIDIIIRLNRGKKTFMGIGLNFNRIGKVLVAFIIKFKR
jgi:hypothetical protein